MKQTFCILFCLVALTVCASAATPAATQAVAPTVKPMIPLGIEVGIPIDYNTRVMLADGGPLPMCPPRCHHLDGSCSCCAICAQTHKPAVSAPAVAEVQEKPTYNPLADGTDPMPICRLKRCW